MTISLYHEMDVSIRGRRITRRDTLRAISFGALATGSFAWTDLVTANASRLRQQGMSCILLWMQGGPSQFETFSPKPDNAAGGETKAIATSVPGIQIAENLPQLATMMDDICVIRSMRSAEGSHPRGTYLMHTGYIPTASIKYPTFGSHVAHQLGDDESDLPSFVRIGSRTRGGTGAGFLGVDYDPFDVTDPSRPPDNTTLPTDENRFDRRRGLLTKLESYYQQTGGQQKVTDHRKLYDKAARMVKSSQMDAFQLDGESAKTREAYGTSKFGDACLMARRLIESGVTFVEVSSSVDPRGNWDTHQENFDRSRELCRQIDQPFAQLLRDLRQRGRLENTLVIWMGEFGRTPRINPRGGRDHFPRAFNVALAGGGVHGGQVIGQTSPDGQEITQRPVGVTDLFRTICRGLQIDADHENYSSIGRPVRIVDDGTVVSEVFG